MTHTLHRRGDEDSLSRDYVFLMMPSKDINHVNSAPRLKRFFELALENGCLKIGDARSGNEYFQGGVEKMINNVQDRAVIQAVFTEKEKVINMLKALKEENLGLSVVLSGILDEVNDCCHQAGLQRHTVEHSLGIWGKTELLPGEEVLEINTMCGHGMVTIGLINDVIKRIQKGRLTIQEGAKELAKPCMCGIFNDKRAEEILTKLLNS